MCGKTELRKTAMSADIRRKTAMNININKSSQH